MKKALAATLALLVAVSLSACGSGGQTSGGTETTQSAGVPAPVIMSVDDLDGSTVEISTTRPLVVNSEDPTAWSGTVEDSSVAEFTPGEVTKTAEYNFGFKGIGTGQTEASVTDGSKTITFTIIVK